MRRYVPALCAVLSVLSACAGASRMKPSRPIEKVITHEVREGESWRSIANDFYRDEKRAAELASFNEDDPQHHPMPGSGIRVPLSKADLELLEQKLDAASAYNNGVELAERGNYGEAVEQFQRAIAIDPRMHDAAFNLAVTYQKLGLHVKAIPLLKDLTEQVPGSAQYRFALGASHFHTGNFGEAKDAFMQTLEIDRTHTRALFSLAVVHEKLSELGEALRCWSEYLELDSEGPWADEARAHREALLRRPEPER